MRNYRRSARFVFRAFYVMLASIFVFSIFYIAAYGLPEIDKAKLTGDYADHEIDTDEDGLYDFLTVDTGVYVWTPEEYSLMGSLYDLMNREVVWSIDHRNLSTGYHIMHLNFDGKTIEKHGVNGPYCLKDITLSSGSSDTGLSICDCISGAYITSAYNYTDFVDSVTLEKMMISGIGYAELLLTIAIKDTVPVYSGRYSYDIMDFNIPPISTPYNVTSSAGSGYSYDLPNVHIPGKPNNYTVTADGVENLNIGLKKLQGDRTRAWINTQTDAGEDNKAIAETDLISPHGSYRVKIFGDAAENVSEVDLTMIVVKKIILNGRFEIGIDTTGLPNSDYMITAKVVHGAVSFDKPDDDEGLSVQGSRMGGYIITGI